MLKILAILLLLPAASMANDPCTQASCDQVFNVHESHPKLQGMEVQLENGESMPLVDFLENISEESDDNGVVIFGGEVPWPVTEEECEKNPNRKGCN